MREVRGGSQEIICSVTLLPSMELTGHYITIPHNHIIVYNANTKLSFAHIQTNWAVISKIHSIKGEEGGGRREDPAFFKRYCYNPFIQRDRNRNLPIYQQSRRNYLQQNEAFTGQYFIWWYNTPGGSSSSDQLQITLQCVQTVTILQIPHHGGETFFSIMFQFILCFILLVFWSERNYYHHY